MYNLNDTIIVISSPPAGARAIVRITGPATIEICRQVFKPAIDKLKTQISKLKTLIAGSVAIDDELEIDAMLYLFFAPHSYTGDDVAEFHIYASASVIETLVDSLLAPKFEIPRVRLAGPGEFTARAYLNGKIDLAQAEAVNEIIVSSNTFQLAAAQKLLSGRLGATTKKLRSAIMDCLSLLEAGLDFSSENIELEIGQQVEKRLAEIRGELSQLLSESGRYESIIDLPAVGIAGAPNAGKSSLLNKLLNKQRSIVSHQPKTTRDVLTGELTLRHCRCVLFDCAGLTVSAENVLDQLSQQAAIEALRNSSLVVFCVDISKDDWTEDLSVLYTLNPIPYTLNLVGVATKSDLPSQHELNDRIARANNLFGAQFLPISVKTGAGLKNLRDAIDRKLIEKFEIPRVSVLALTARHRQSCTEAIASISESISELKAGNDEVAAMMLRAAYQCISDIESACGQIDEQILERIFSRFCIGK